MGIKDCLLSFSFCSFESDLGIFQNWIKSFSWRNHIFIAQILTSRTAVIILFASWTRWYLSTTCNGCFRSLSITHLYHLFISVENQTILVWISGESELIQDSKISFVIQCRIASTSFFLSSVIMRIISFHLKACSSIQRFISSSSSMIFRPLSLSFQTSICWVIIYTFELDIQQRRHTSLQDRYHQEAKI